MDQLLLYDEWLFRLINGVWHHAFLDAVMPFLRNKYFWAPVYLFILSFLLLNYGKRVWYVIFFAIVTIVLSDQISSSIIKPLVGRLRPCNLDTFKESVRLLIDCGSGKSFTSSHATNHFGIATYFVSIFRHRFKWVVPVGFLWAALISYGQIYVGVHYPLDILGGAIIGILIGLYSYTMVKFLVNVKRL